MPRMLPLLVKARFRATVVCLRVTDAPVATYRPPPMPASVLGANAKNGERKGQEFFATTTSRRAIFAASPPSSSSRLAATQNWMRDSRLGIPRRLVHSREPGGSGPQYPHPQPSPGNATPAARIS